jgi:hypothetical protein
MKKVWVKTLVALVGMFLLGGISGWFLGRNNPPVSILRPTTSHALEDHIIDRLTTRLSLTPDQITAVRPIVVETAAKIVESQNETLDKITVILAERDDQITPLLTDAQKQKLADMKIRRKTFLGHVN